jgi:hypothetical protein
MKSLLVSILAAGALGLSSRSVAQDHAVALPGTTADQATIESNNQSATASRKAEESNTAEHDDTLYRGKTSETENPMNRDEGPLHFKSRPKEKLQEVDSLKNLRTSGSDPTFQGSLLHNSVTSIEDVGPKPGEAAKLQEPSAPRYRRHQVFPVPNDAAKSEPNQAKAESSPSPSPSPSPSAAASPTPSR